MVTAETNATLREKSNYPNMLAKRAKSDIRSTGKTMIRWPKCNTMLEITITSGGERIMVACECGYVHDVDINF